MWHLRTLTFVVLSDLAHSCDQGCHLEQRSASLDDPHVTRPDLLDELELDVLGHLVVVLADSEDISDDVLRGVSQLPEVVHRLVRLVHVAGNAVVQHVADQEGVWFIANLTK